MEKLLQLVQLLRQCGVKVGSEETVALVRALMELPQPLSVEQLKTVSQAMLIKDKRQVRLFEYLFTAVFSEHEIDDKADGCNSLVPLEIEGASSDGKGLAQQGTGNGSKLTYFIKIGQFNRAKAIVDREVDKVSSELPLEEQLRKVKVRLDWNMEKYRLEKEREHLKDELYMKYSDQLINLENNILEKLLKNMINEGNFSQLVELSGMLDLTKKSLVDLDKSEEAQIRREITGIGRKLAVKKKRKWKRSSRGVLDLAKTIKKASNSDGKIIELQYKQHKVSRPNLFLLCDVSGSVATYTQFMLLLVYSMQQSFKKVRSFVFIDDIEEITEVFHKGTVEEAIANLKTRAQCSTSGKSDFGKVFNYFCQRFLSELTPKTDVVILGDARNNWNNPQADKLEEIRNNCRNIYWLNPENEYNWGTEDSVIYQYKPYCRQVLECGNLEKLVHAAKVISS
ncbi:hypothetical protein GGQ84_002249 [Desulfitispora alkaliphila]|uniref:VWA domain-containing protein n=1 Tax=Desulfitispora alkaliphila TaxID=622674 RepID=UPI003D202DCB